jgi:hypothetical protein
MRKDFAITLGARRTLDSRIVTAPGWHEGDLALEPAMADGNSRRMESHGERGNEE